MRYARKRSPFSPATTTLSDKKKKKKKVGETNFQSLFLSLAALSLSGSFLSLSLVALSRRFKLFAVMSSTVSFMVSRAGTQRCYIYVRKYAESLQSIVLKPFQNSA